MCFYINDQMSTETNANVTNKYGYDKNGCGFSCVVMGVNIYRRDSCTKESRKNLASELFNDL